MTPRMVSSVGVNTPPKVPNFLACCMNGSVTVYSLKIIQKSIENNALRSFPSTTSMRTRDDLKGVGMMSFSCVSCVYTKHPTKWVYGPELQLQENEIQAFATQLPYSVIRSNWNLKVEIYLKFLVWDLGFTKVFLKNVPIHNVCFMTIQVNF